MNIYLLTHQRETHRKTNTGTLVTDALGENCSVFIWNRKSPNPTLLKAIAQSSVALLYPCEESVSMAETSETFNGFIIIDATWQEAQKMYNHSPYLKALPKVRLDRNKPSSYTLRRNQKEDGLCTAESAAEILKVYGEQEAAEHIERALGDFMLQN